MTIEEAKLILSSVRPADPDDSDPQVLEALALMKQATALAAWYDEQQALDRAIARKLREAMPCPTNLKSRLLASRPIVRPAAWWRRHSWLTAAACLMVLTVMGAWMAVEWPHHFSEFEAAMVEHSSNIADEAMLPAAGFDDAVKLLAQRGAYTNFVLPTGLLTNQTFYAVSSFKWAYHRVSLLRFKMPAGKHADFFVLENPRLRDISHNCEPDFREPVGNYSIAYWYGHRTDFYLVTAPKDADLSKLLGAATP